MSHVDDWKTHVPIAVRVDDEDQLSHLSRQVAERIRERMNDLTNGCVLIDSGTAQPDIPEPGDDPITKTGRMSHSFTVNGGSADIPDGYLTTAGKRRGFLAGAMHVTYDVTITAVVRFKPLGGH